MKRAFYMTASVIASILAIGCQKSESTEQPPQIRMLLNGIRVVSIHFPASTNVSVFTFLPMGLTSDDAGQAQWSHLVEHLVIRSTLPANSAEANAETLPDHMRLDFYGHSGNWKEGLTHHRRWLEGVPFAQASLAAEKPRVVAECDFTARNFATHKFAVAAWSQGLRHGNKHVALKGDVTKATLADVQRFRDERLAVSNHVTVCIVGGVEAKEVFAETEKQLGTLLLPGKAAPVASATVTNLHLTWDLDARHLLLAWPIPGFHHDEHASLMVAAQLLNMRFFSDEELKRDTGMILAGADLTTPEGSYFFVSASLRAGVKSEDVRRVISKHLKLLASGEGHADRALLIGRQLADSLLKIPDPQSLRNSAPANVSPAMIEGNLGLLFAMQEHRYGDRRASLARSLTDVSADSVREVVRKHLSAMQASVCTLNPARDHR